MCQLPILGRGHRFQHFDGVIFYPLKRLELVRFGRPFLKVLLELSDSCFTPLQLLSILTGLMLSC